MKPKPTPEEIEEFFRVAYIALGRPSGMWGLKWRQLRANWFGSLEDYEEYSKGWSELGVHFRQYFKWLEEKGYGHFDIDNY